MERNNLNKKINQLDNLKDIELIRLEIYSILVAMILSKELFKTNIEIKSFVESMDIEVKEYLLKNRSMILTKVIRNVKTADNVQIQKYIQLIKSQYITCVNNIDEKIECEKINGIEIQSKNNKPIKKSNENYMSELMKKYSR